MRQSKLAKNVCNYRTDQDSDVEHGEPQFDGAQGEKVTKGKEEITQQQVTH